MFWHNTEGPWKNREGWDVSEIICKWYNPYIQNDQLNQYVVLELTRDFIPISGCQIKISTVPLHSSNNQLKNKLLKICLSAQTMHFAFSILFTEENWSSTMEHLTNT